MKLIFRAILIFLFLNSCVNKKEEKETRLPFIGNYDIEYSTHDGVDVVDTVYPKIPYFSYINHDSVWINSDSLKNKILIADFFFTSCPTICPKMTSQMKRLSFLTKDLRDYVQFLSFSINPKVDKPSRLRQYRKQYGIDVSNWQFLTGDEEETHALGINYFQVFANKDIESEGGYAHSPAFVLIDRNGFVRGVYVGTETEQVNQLEKDLRKLLKDEYKVDSTRKN
jgi:protein SCO1